MCLKNGYWTKNSITGSILVLLVLLSSGNIIAQRSKITGTMKDAQTGEVLIGANIIILNTSLGAASDINGKFNIINVPVGIYQVQGSMIGYAKQIVQNVLVSADRVATVDFNLTSNTTQKEEVVVTAERNELHKEVSGSQMVITSDQLTEAAGIREINTFLEKQPGVGTNNGYLEIRGGSADQTGTMVNGMAYNNAANGNSETSIPLSAINQISLLSGGFNAEYGNFRSGLINITTKSGTKSAYHGTINASRDNTHMKRFGPKMSDPYSPALRPFLDPNWAFNGTDAAWAGYSDDQKKYLSSQYDQFTGGWNQQANTYNQGKALKDQATPLDLYLLSAWMQMAVPDFKALSDLGYNVSPDQQKLFRDHAWKEETFDYNIDGGFGGPIPFISEGLGDATFYISHNSSDQNYIIPLARPDLETHVTLATIKSTPTNSLTLLFNGLWKTEHGMSQIRPAFGDFPDASRQGGFMPINNVALFTKVGDNIATGYWYDPNLYAMLDESTLMGGVNANYVLNNSSFLELSLSALKINDSSPTGDNRNPTVVTQFGPFPVTEMPYGKDEFGNTKVYGPTDTIDYKNNGLPSGITYPNRRFQRKEGDLYDNVTNNQYRGKLDFVSQIGEHHYFKSGIEYNSFIIDNKLWMKWNTNAYNTYEYNYHRTPSQTGAYAQDQITYEGIVANVGLRADYFYGGGGLWPSGDPFSTNAFINVPFANVGAGAQADSFFAILASGRSIIWDYWYQYNQTHPGFLQPVKNYFSLSPRIGIAFPVTEDSKFYFNYGHFRSNPPYYSMYMIRYRYTKQGLYNMANPNLEPPKTISYELGFSTYLPANIILNLSGYYKDVSGQQGDVQYQNSAGINYHNYLNNNYQDVQGLEINLTKNDNSWITGWVNFNYMLQKSGYTGTQLISDVPLLPSDALYNGNEQRFLPKPQLNASFTFTSPDDLFDDKTLSLIASQWRLTLFVEWDKGDYFTWNPLNTPHVNNNINWPDYFMVDLKLGKTFNFLGVSTTFYMDINNLFDLKVSLLNKGYAFNSLGTDFNDYMTSLHLTQFNSSDYDALRTANPGKYIAGNDKPGDLNSTGKPYINDPNYSYFVFGQPRDIWFGIKIDF